MMATMRSRNISWFLLCSILFTGWCAPCRAAEVAVQIQNAPATGTVAFVLFDSANAFGDFRDPVKVVRYPSDGRDVYRITDLPPGDYAMLVYADENNNGRIDKNFIGIPREPLGFSNGYRPKGPPSYSRALFSLTENEPRQFDVTLSRPLGKRGRLGAGVGVIARSSPYRDYEGGVYQVIPAVVYIGDRFQIFGPYCQAGLLGSGKLRLAAVGKYRIGVYKEDDSSFLSGMGDRKSTFMLGLALQTEWPGGVDLSVSYEHDVLGRMGGGAAGLKLNRSFQSGHFRFSPSIGLNWLSAKLSSHDYGVTDDQATVDRPAYRLDDTLSVEGGMGISVEINRNWMAMADISVERLDKDVTDSPIVSQDYVIAGFATITRVF